MRRIASVFKKKSSKKSEGKQEQLQHDAPATLDRRSQSVPHLLAPSHPAYSSSASSTASADLRTPDDDGQHSGRFPSPPLSDSPAGKKTWIASWVGGRKSSTLRRNTTQDALPELPPAPQQQPKRQTPSPALTTTTTATPRRPAASAPGKSGPSRRSAVSSDQNSEGSTSEEEDSSDEDEDGGRETFLTSAYHRPTPSPSALSPTQPTYPNALPNTPAIANLRALTAQGFLPPFSPPPLLHLPGKPLFPRSSNTSSSLPREESLRSRAHRQRLAHRLRNGPPLSAAEAREIAPFATRKQGTGVSPKRTSFQLDESAVSDVRRIGAYSRGLNRWASRPCIEDRLVEWRLDTEDGLCSSPISGRPGFAVADLEFSDDLELLAGLRPSAIPDDMPEPSTASSASSSVVNLTVTRPPLPERPKSHPSPLRVDHVPQPSSSAPSSSFKPPSPPAPAPRQAVRFAEDADATEFVPLGYALQQKQRRESKAQFLREQQELRAREEERKRHEEERRKMEAERAQWAAERSAREEERRRHEEEKRQRKIAEDYVRARERQSTQRAGFVPGHSSSASRDRVDEFGQQQPQRRHERQGSSGSIQQQPQLPSNLRHLSEPIAPSVSGRDASPRRAHFPQQPQLSQQSSFAGSSEDLRARSMSGGSQRGGDASERGRRTRRVSGHSSASTSALAARASSAFSGHQSYPQQPGLMYGAPQQGVMEMPLLPPSAPFMMQSYGGGRRGSMSSAGGSSAHSNSNSRSGSASPARSAGSSASGSRVSLVGGGSDRVQRASARPASHRRQSSGGSLGGSPGMPYMLPRSGSMPNQWGVQPQQQQQMMMPMYGMAAPVYGMYGSPMMQQQQVPMQVPYAMAGQYAQRSMPIAGRQSIIF